MLPQVCFRYWLPVQAMTAAVATVAMCNCTMALTTAHTHVYLLMTLNVRAQILVMYQLVITTVRGSMNSVLNMLMPMIAISPSMKKPSKLKMIKLSC